MTAKLNIEHAHRQADRFSKAAVLLALAMTGEIRHWPPRNPREILPVVVKVGDRFACYYNSRAKSADADMDLLVPFITNASFSLELYLKVLFWVETATWANGHDLHALFQKLSEPTQAHIGTDFTASTMGPRYQAIKNQIRSSAATKDFEWDVDSILISSANAFVEWRYAFEKKPGWFAGFWELRQALINRIDSANSTISG